MKIQYLSQSGFLIETENGKRLVFDPWLESPKYRLELEDIPKVDYVFITHAHDDHGLQSGIALAIRDHATFVSGYDIVKYAMEQGVQSVEKANVGGMFDSGEIGIALTQAVHSSDIGEPVGFVVKVDGMYIYHMGDTGYFAGMNTLGNLYNLDIVFIPIGGRYTMGPAEAMLAIKDLRPDMAIPMHYNTFPKIAQDGEAFKNNVEMSTDTQVALMTPGEQRDF